MTIQATMPDGNLTYIKDYRCCWINARRRLHHIICGSTGRCGSLQCRRRKNIPGQQTLSINYCKTIQWQRDCSHRIRSKRNHQSISGQCCIVIRLQSQTKKEFGGQEKNLVCGCRQCQQKVLHFNDNTEASTHIHFFHLHGMQCRVLQSMHHAHIDQTL